MVNLADKVSTIAKTMARVENWQEYLFWSLGLRPRDSLIKLRNGLKYEIRKDDISDKYAVVEVWVKEFYFRDGFGIGKDDVVIDIGAHIGAFSLYAGGCAKNGRILCFEPMKGSFGLLRRNIELNGFRNILPVNLGLASKKGAFTIHAQEGNSTCAGAYTKGSPHEITCITLKDVFDDYDVGRCNFLKMDCEGMEYEILLNAPKELFDRIDKIVLECHDSWVEGCSRHDLRRLLEGNGFSVFMKGSMMYAKKPSG